MCLLRFVLLMRFKLYSGTMFYALLRQKSVGCEQRQSTLQGPPTTLFNKRFKLAKRWFPIHFSASGSGSRTSIIHTHWILSPIESNRSRKLALSNLWRRCRLHSANEDKAPFFSECATCHPNIWQYVILMNKKKTLIDMLLWWRWL